MAFTKTSNYNNLPNGNFSPIIYSQKVQKFFRTASVAEAITNTDYAGEIENYGDTVNIIKEPTVSVSSYTRGAVVNIQDIQDDQLQLTVDQANAFAFKVDDIEERHSHINFESVSTSSGAYALKNAYDQNVIAAMFAGPSSSSPDHVVGSDGSGVDTGFGSSEIDPVDIISKHGKLLNLQDVPEENRWFLGSPEFYEQMGQASSKLMSDTTGSATPLRNGKVYSGKVMNMELYMTNNFAASSTSNYFKVLSGHMSSTATANHIAKIEVIRDTDSFSDVVRGLHVFGRKVLRDTALVAEHLLID
jgi:hypothetical protein|tara:strand:- start:78 stop:986 length:909 start_codon:yes stop_codon:yes gene_type:complete